MNIPESEDYVISNCGKLGEKTCVGIVEHGFIKEFNSLEKAEKFIKEKMKKKNYYPDVWFQDDHGGLSPISL